MRKDLERRIEALEEKAKPPVVSTLRGLVLWLADHENDPDDTEIELSPELQELVGSALRYSGEDDCKAEDDGTRDGESN